MSKSKKDELLHSMARATLSYEPDYSGKILTEKELRECIYAVNKVLKKADKTKIKYDRLVLMKDNGKMILLNKDDLQRLVHKQDQPRRWWQVWRGK